MRFVSIALGLSVGACIGGAAPGAEGEVDGTTNEPDVAQESVSCPDGCAADFACREDGEVNPRNVCEVCDVARDRNGWSPVMGIKSCDDGDNCTGAGQCQGGICARGEPTKACAVTGQCVLRCDDHCKPVIVEGTCFIDGVCHASGDIDPRIGCRTCQPSRSQTQWSGTNAPCDDGDGCTYDDSCTNAGCMGVLNTCDDGRACTSDFCDGGQCQNPVTDGCLIGDGCVAAGASPPATPCLVCDPNVSRTTLSVAVGASCDDGDACTVASTCGEDGRCMGPVTSIEPEPNDTISNAHDLGIADGSEFPEGQIAANLSTASDLDVFRWGMPFEVGGIIRSPRAAIATDALMPVELCVFATCGQSSQAASAPTLECPSSSTPRSLDALTPGCCRTIGDGQGSLVIDALCISVTTGFGYASVRAIGEAAAASCGGYDLKWGSEQ